MFKPFDALTGPITGRTLIEASAGTGKTFTISRIFLRLVLEKKLQVDQILVVTFTEAATNELKERIHATLINASRVLAGNHIDDPKLEEYITACKTPLEARRNLEHAIQNFDEAAILTIHRFCNRILQEDAFESGSLFDTDLVTEQTSLVRQIVEDFWRKHFYEAPGLFLRYALEKVNPLSLLKLLGNRVGRLHLQIVPESVTESVSNAEGAFCTSYDTTRQQWHSSGAELMQFLKNCDGLYKNVTDKLPRIKELTDLYFRPTEANPSLFDDFKYLTEGGIKIKKNHKLPEHPFLRQAQIHYDNFLALENQYNRRLIGIKAALFAYVQSELKTRKQQQNVFYFDDLLFNVYAALNTNNAKLADRVRKKYEAALIDEFQDTDPVQYEIFDQIFNANDSTLFLIGDPKQAIYGFRGADIFAYMQAKSDTASCYTLNTNYRSASELVTAFNAVFSNVENTFLYQEIPFQQAKAANRKDTQFAVEVEDDEPLQVWFWDPEANKVDGRKPTRDETKTSIIEAVATEIVRLLNLSRQGKALIGDRRLQEKDIAVLVRANAEAREVQAALNIRGVNSVLYSSDNLFAAPEVVEMERILAAIIEPARTSLLKAALATEIMGVAGSELLQFTEDDERLESWFYRFSRYHDLWQEHGFIRMFRELLSEEELQPRLMSFPDGERRITNLLHLAETLNEATVSKRLGMSGLLKWLVEQRVSIDRSIEEHQIRLESDENAVKLVTMHMSKGLEYPVVFCPFTWFGSQIWQTDILEFHDDEKGNAFTLDLGSDKWEANKTLAEKEKLSENLRLLYVAMTRAKHRCYLVLGPFAGANTSAPAYLLHRPVPFNEEQPVEALKNHMKSLKGDDYKASIRKIAGIAGGAIRFSDMREASAAAASAAPIQSDTLRSRQFKTKIDTTSRISSYTSLVARQPHGEELADHDMIGLFSARWQTKAAGDTQEFGNFRQFPRGAKTGLFVHDLFQNLDYTRLSQPETSAYIEQKLQDYRFELQWAEAVRAMIHDVLELKITARGHDFSLSQIPAAQRLNETEFYFPIQKLSPGRLTSLFALHSGNSVPEAFLEKIADLTFAAFKGYMKGFIDLVFEHRGRYYIVDWKSNFLGHTVEDYDVEKLTTAMVDNYYILQYHIYTVALHQYLKIRLPDYNYRSHFGGILYVFARGVDKKRSSMFGVFQSQPPEEMISELTKIMVGENA